ncbi:hypothetical protein HTY52_22785 [Cupriavidus taiwanensis]|nr:hypothetical protein [Cupriavidus taiwanensis]NSX16922.1 hypothetical protein [Cupriavidus taiwanensis]
MSVSLVGGDVQMRRRIMLRVTAHLAYRALDDARLFHLAIRQIEET